VVHALMLANPMTYAMSAVRRGMYGAELPAGLVPAGSSAALELGVCALFAVLATLAAAALCRRRA
jgi:ABC-type polysaccharide/polyol phosphate export permease